MTVWRERIELTDLWEGYADDNMSFLYVRDETERRLRASRWLQRQPEGINDVREQVDMLAMQDDIEGFDFEWGELMKLADRDRVWLERMMPARET